MKRLIIALAVSTVGWVQFASSAYAGPGVAPPPPPPPPNCKSCPGPPPPPTQVPTPVPTVVAPQPVVDVKLETPKVSRGHAAKVTVDASTDDRVTVVVHYHRRKAATYHAKIGSSGTLVKSWKIPKTAPVGKAAVVVTVSGGAAKVSRKFVLFVTK